MVITTSNGTRALLACLEAETVLVGSFVNFAATCQQLLHEERPVHLVCAGTEGQVSYEDTLLAGAFARHFRDLGHPLQNDPAEIASGLWARIEEAVWHKRAAGERVDEAAALARYLGRGQGGRRVLELGLGRDIEAAARLNRPDHQIVAELRRDPLRLVARGVPARAGAE